MMCAFGLLRYEGAGVSINNYAIYHQTGRSWHVGTHTEALWDADWHRPLNTQDRISKLKANSTPPPLITLMIQRFVNCSRLTLQNTQTVK